MFSVSSSEICVYLLKWGKHLRKPHLYNCTTSNICRFGFVIRRGSALSTRLQKYFNTNLHTSWISSSYYFWVKKNSCRQLAFTSAGLHADFYEPRHPLPLLFRNPATHLLVIRAQHDPAAESVAQVNHAGAAAEAQDFGKGDSHGQD